jgi:hypothetical protein
VAPTFDLVLIIDVITHVVRRRFALEVRFSNRKPNVIIIGLDPGSCGGCLFSSGLRAFRLNGWCVAPGLIEVSIRTGAIDSVGSKLVEGCFCIDFCLYSDSSIFGLARLEESTVCSKFA